MRLFFILCRQFVRKYILYRHWFSMVESVNMTFAHHLGNRGTAYFHRKVLGYLENSYGDIVKKYSGMTSYPTEWDMESLPIYVFWYQGLENMPDIVRASYNSIMRHKGTHNVILLDRNNLTDYVEIPKTILDKINHGYVNYTKLSNIVRQILLTKGCIWMDATIYLTEDIHLPSLSLYTIRTPEINGTKFVGKQKLTSYFFASYPNNPLFLFERDILCRYYENEDVLIDYFLMDYCYELCYRTCPAAKAMLDRVPFNNVDVYFLAENLNCKYNPEEFNKIKQGTNIFKLSYKTYIDKGKKDTYYDYIVSSKL